MASYNITIDNASQRFLDSLPSLSPRILAAVGAAMDYQNQLTIGDITVKRLNYPKEGSPQPDGLRHQSGLLKKSLYAKASVVTGNGVASAIGSSVKYAAIHEFGGKTAAHTITATNAKALCFWIGDRKVFAKSVKHPGSQMPARRYVRGVLDERAQAYVASFAAAIKTEFSNLA